MIRKTNLAHRSNYGNKRSTSSIKYIVVHYTANDGDSDENNGKYFNGANRHASAHIFVDDDSCTQSVPDDYVAWSVGGKKYSNTNGAKFYGKATNSNTLNVEMCDTVRNGKYEATEKTQENTITIIKEKMRQYNIPIDRVIRHYDVTGKLCPAYFVDEGAWEAFKSKITGSNVSVGGSSTKPSVGSGYNGNSIVDYLKSIGKDSSFEARKQYAAQYGITGYAGTAAQNSKLLSLMRGGSSGTSSSGSSGGYYPAFSSSSIVDGLESIGEDSSKETRAAIAVANGINNYSGTYDQNVRLCDLARQGRLKRPGVSSGSTSAGSAEGSGYQVGEVYTLQSNMKVRTGPGTGYRMKSHSELTADGRERDKDKNGCLDAGTRVTCIAVETSGDQTWIECPSGWICARDGGTVYVA